MATATQHKKAPAPDFRYVWLVPPVGPNLVGWLLVDAALIGAVWLSLPSVHPLQLMVFAVATILVTLVIAHSRTRSALGSSAVPMAIVPWGVIVRPDTEPRFLHWAAIQRITVREKHIMRGGTPSVVSSVVTVRTRGERFSGWLPGPAALERLTVNLEEYRREAGRLVAIDLDGAEPMAADEPSISRLVRQGQEMCTSARGATRLHLPAGGYRRVAAPIAGPQTVVALRNILRSESLSGADPRPLAAIIVASLNVVELVPELMVLTTSPHPIVAATAKAAALRLGAPINRVGSLDEVSAFLFEPDMEAIHHWANHPSPPERLTRAA